MMSSAGVDDRARHAAGGRRRAKQEMSGRLSPTAVQHPEVATASQNVQGLQGQQVRHSKRPGTGHHRSAAAGVPSVGAAAGGSPGQRLGSVLVVTSFLKSFGTSKWQEILLSGAQAFLGTS
ncbi:hypothetical protein MRX96_029937 [Rhipicephalus microplus]